MDTEFVRKRLECCPICGGELTSMVSGNTMCTKCKELFEYNSSRKIWKNRNIIDIAYLDPNSSVLSNLFPHVFAMSTIYGMIKFASMEAFFRCLCLNNDTIDAIYDLANLSGMDAYRVRHALPDWRVSQKVFWNGKYIERESEEYKELLKNAYDTMFECNPLFRMALKKTKGKILMHTMGETNPKETLLTPNEYMEMLNRERDRL